MSLDDAIKQDLLSDEGFSHSAYHDHLGFLTIGIGRMIDERRGGGITFEEAKYLLGNDIERVSRDLADALPWFKDAPYGVKRALINMGFQMGVKGVLGFGKTLKLIEQGKFSDAANQMLISKWAQQTPERAKRVAGWVKKANSGFIGGNEA